MTPKIPYQFTVKRMKVDASWSFLQKFNYRLMFMTNSLIEYLLDILYWRVDPFVFKTAEFSKRNFNRTRSALSHLIYEIKKVKRGFGKLKNDCLFVLGVKKQNINYKYKREGFMEGQKVRQVKIDVIKFIPFSFFILIPGAEILLPPFLVIFPNSVPS